MSKLDFDNVQTRSGLKVEIFKVDVKHDVYPIVGIVITQDSEEVGCWTETGESSMYRNSPMDLVPIPQNRPYKKVKWEFLGRIVINKSSEVQHIVTGLDGEDNLVCINSHWISLDYLFNNYLWEGGDCCGE